MIDTLILIFVILLFYSSFNNLSENFEINLNRCQKYPYLKKCLLIKNKIRQLNKLL